MLYTYTYRKSKIEKINIYIRHFFKAMYHSKEKELNMDLLDKEFKKIVSECDNLRNDMKSIFTIYKSLDSTNQEKIYSAFKKNNMIKEICSGKVEPVREKDIPEVLREPLKNLFKYLYEDLPKTKVFKIQCGCFHQYHQTFINDNEYATYCPFCGLKTLTRQGEKYRDAYDHYLPKSVYIFNSINFRNLAPICDICNSDIKRTNPMVYDKSDQKRKVFYPFDNSYKNTDIKVNVQYDSNQKLNVGFDYPETIKEEVDSWSDIFDIKSRYEYVIKDYSKRWFERLRSKYKRRKDNNSFEDFVKEYIRDTSDRGYDERGFLEKAYLEFLFMGGSLEYDLNETKGA